MAVSRVSKAASDAARRRAELAQQRANVLSRDVFLRNQGPRVIELPPLPVWGVPLLMKRVDVLQLTRTGHFPEPITATVVEIVRKGGLTVRDAKQEVVYNAFDADHLLATLDASAAVAMACIIAPPPEYLAGEIDAADIDPRMCKPLFVPVGTEPDDDQVVLEWAMPDEDGEIDELLDGASGRMSARDLGYIFEAAYKYGPGALGAEFRPLANTLAALGNVAGRKPARAAKPAA